MTEKVIQNRDQNKLAQPDQAGFHPLLVKSAFEDHADMKVDGGPSDIGAQIILGKIDQFPIPANMRFQIIPAQNNPGYYGIRIEQQEIRRGPVNVEAIEAVLESRLHQQSSSGDDKQLFVFESAGEDPPNSGQHWFRIQLKNTHLYVTQVGKSADIVLSPDDGTTNQLWRQA